MNRFPSLIGVRKEAVSALRSALNGHGDAQKLLRKNGSRLQLAAQQDRDFYKNPLMSAIERECGPLFKALETESLSPAAQRRLRASVLLICPLLGVLATTDQVPEYLCPVGAQTRNGVRSLHHLWKPSMTSILNRLCSKRVVFSFLKGRLRSLWDRSPSSGSLVRLGFARVGSKGYRGEHAGAGRLAGELLRHILTAGVTTADELMEWESSAGHTFSREHSVLSEAESSLIFLRS